MYPVGMEPSRRLFSTKGRQKPKNTSIWGAEHTSLRLVKTIGLCAAQGNVKTVDFFFCPFFFNSRCRVAANSLHSKEIGCGFQGESRGWFERGGKKIYLSLQTACAVWAISLFSHPAPFKHAEWSWCRDPLCLTVSVGDLRGGREVIGKCH